MRSFSDWVGSAMLCGCGMNFLNQKEHWSIVLCWKCLALGFMDESETKYVAAVWQLGWTASETLHSYTALKCRCQKKHLSDVVIPFEQWKLSKKMTNIFVECVGPTALMVRIVKKKNKKKQKLFLQSYKRDGWFVGWLVGSLPHPLPNNQTHKHNYSLFLSGGGNTDSSSVLDNRNLLCSQKV